MLRRPYVHIINKPDGTVVIRPRFNLRQADVPKRESRKYLEQHASAFLMREDDARFKRPISSRYDWITRQHNKARHVTRVILYPVFQNLQPVNLGGACARYRRRVVEIVGGDKLSGSRGVVHGLAGDVETELCECALALSETLRV
ncbi:hypothetical protein YC2023_112447 [Brassica napus]